MLQCRNDEPHRPKQQCPVHDKAVRREKDNASRTARGRHAFSPPGEGGRRPDEGPPCRRQQCCNAETTNHIARNNNVPFMKKQFGGRRTTHLVQRVAGTPSPRREKVAGGRMRGPRADASNVAMPKRRTTSPETTMSRS